MRCWNVPRAFQSLAIAIAGLVAALPLLGLNCEACDLGGAGAAIAERPALAAYCPSPGAVPPARSSEAPATPDGCGHHHDSAALKRGNGGRVSALAATPLASAGCAFDRLTPAVDSQSQGIAPQRPTALPRVLRL